MKTGLFVGSFNPITVAHETIANDLIKENILDYIYFIPVNSKKTGLVSINERIEMINLILKEQEQVLSIYNYSATGLFNYEILEKIKKEKHITHIIMGSDLFLKFNTFSNYQEILNHYTLIIINRENNINNYIEENYKNYKNNIILVNKKYKGSSYLAKIDLLENKNQYLNPKVLDYIKKNKLYE